MPAAAPTPHAIGHGQRPESLGLLTRGCPTWPRKPWVFGGRDCGPYITLLIPPCSLLGPPGALAQPPSPATRTLHYRRWRSASGRGLGARAPFPRLRPHRPTASVLHIYSRFTFEGGGPRLPLGYYAFFWCDSPRSPSDGSKHPSDVTRLRWTWALPLRTRWLDSERGRRRSSGPSAGLPAALSDSRASALTPSRRWAAAAAPPTHHRAFPDGYPPRAEHRWP